MARKPTSTRPSVELPPASELMPLVTKAIDEFKGQSSEIESAIGFLFMGHAFGWKVMHLIHSQATVRKYETILGIKAREVFPAETAHSNRSVGFSIAIKLSNFWKAVKGEVDNKEVRSRVISDVIADTDT